MSTSYLFILEVTDESVPPSVWNVLYSENLSLPLNPRGRKDKAAKLKYTYKSKQCNDKEQ